MKTKLIKMTFNCHHLELKNLQMNSLNNVQDKDRERVIKIAESTKSFKKLKLNQEILIRYFMFEKVVNRNLFYSKTLKTKV